MSLCSYYSKWSWLTPSARSVDGGPSSSVSLISSWWPWSPSSGGMGWKMATVATAVTTLYLVSEVIFYVVMQHRWIPRGNQRLTPSPYRDYGPHERRRLLNRVLDRMQWMAQHHPTTSFRTMLSQFILGWFSSSPPPASSARDKSEEQQPPQPEEQQLAVLEETTTTSSDTNGHTTSGTGTWHLAQIGQDEAIQFLTWAFYAKHVEELLPEEATELQHCLDLMQQRTGLTFLPGKVGAVTPKTLNLVQLSPWHRPWLLYAVIRAAKLGAGLVFRANGFSRRVSRSTGLVGWYRPAPSSGSQQKPSVKRMPLLFFHGIAPGGATCYIFYILFGLASEDRATFFFEHPNIAYSIGFEALTEEQTALGVTELLQDCLPEDQKNDCGLAMVGHSFGSCTLTWMVHSPALRSRIRQLVLLDPVSILLSEPDVMSNFLYSERQGTIRMVASSELFTEHYLRRHFAWYNSELWLEDIPAEQVYTLVALSENDNIVNVARVKHLVELYQKEHDAASRLELLYWPGLGHAHFLAYPSKWKEIQKRMRQKELEIMT